MNLHTNFRSDKPNMYNTRNNPIFKSQPSLISKAKHENFKPQVEWKEDHSNRLLLIHLPGFKREEIRVQVDNAGKLYIKGSRLAAENKCIVDVDQSLDVPKDVIAEKISGIFEDGCLTLLMPKREITEAKAIAEEKTVSHEASKEEELMQEEKRKESNIDKEGKDENTTEQKTHKKRKLEEEKTEDEKKTEEAMQNEPNQKKKSTIAEAMTSFAKDAKSLLTDAMHNQPTHEKERKSTDADTTRNGFNSKAEAEEMSKNNFDNNDKNENSKNTKAKTDEGMVPQEEKKVKQVMEEVKEKDNGKAKAVSSEMKCEKEKKRERMQKLRLKMNEIYRDTPEAIRKRVNKMREEDGWLNSKYMDSAVEKINRNRNMIVVAVMAFSVGLYVSHRLKARSG